MQSFIIVGYSRESNRRARVIFGIPVILGIFGKIPEARLLDAHTILDF